MGAKIKTLLMPILGLAVLIACFAIVARLLLSRVSPLSQEINTSQAQQDILSQKLAALTQINPQDLSKSEAAYIALPAQNPSATVISQLKKLAIDRNIILDTITVSGSSNETEISNGTIEIKAQGENGAIFSYLRDLETLAPLINVERTKLSSVTGESTQMQLSIRTYWSKFPEKLPAISESIAGLSDEEVNVLTKLASLTPPTFTQLSPTASDTGRQNPFSVE